jgi:hypothetical protein
MNRRRIILASVTNYGSSAGGPLHYAALALNKAVWPDRHADLIARDVRAAVRAMVAG